MNNNDGEAISFSGSMSIGNNENDRKLQGKCETLLEEYEEEITVRIYSYFCLHLPAA